MNDDPADLYRYVKCVYCGEKALALTLMAVELKPGALANLGKKDIAHVHPACLTWFKRLLAHAPQP